MDDDRTLIRRFLRGDQQAFDQLVLRHQAMLRRMIYRATGNLDDANDLAQDVFIKVYHRLDRFRGESQFTTWLYRIAVNTLNSHFRRQRRRSFLSLEEVREPAASDTGEAIRELSDELLVGLSKLSPQQRGVFILRGLQELSVADAAQILGTSENVVKVAYHAARQRLKRGYQAERDPGVNDDA